MIREDIRVCCRVNMNEFPDSDFYWNGCLGLYIPRNFVNVPEGVIDIYSVKPKEDPVLWTWHFICNSDRDDPYFDNYRSGVILELPNTHKQRYNNELTEEDKKIIENYTSLILEFNPEPYSLFWRSVTSGGYEVAIVELGGKSKIENSWNSLDYSYGIQGNNIYGRITETYNCRTWQDVLTFK